MARTANAVRVTLGTGETRTYLAAVLCASYAAPAWRWPLHDDARAAPGLVRNPWAENALAAVAPDARVFIVGSALTMADMMVSLRARGHRGPIHALSRHGLVSHAQQDFHEDYDLLAGAPPPATALALLRLLRRRAREVETHGMPDGMTDRMTRRPVADGLRRTLPAIWQAMPPAERAKLAGRLRSFWDVHRFRMAPQVAAVLAQARADGLFTVSAGRLVSVGRRDGRFLVTWRRRGGGATTEEADAVINCTGPDSDLSRSDNPLFRSLLANGLARPDLLRLGLDLDPRSRVLSRDGEADDRLWAAGPLARPLLGEVVGVPQSSAHARSVAAEVAASLAAEARV